MLNIKDIKELLKYQAKNITLEMLEDIFVKKTKNATENMGFQVVWIEVIEFARNGEEIDGKLGVKGLKFNILLNKMYENPNEQAGILKVFNMYELDTAIEYATNVANSFYLGVDYDSIPKDLQENISTRLFASINSLLESFEYIKENVSKYPTPLITDKTTGMDYYDTMMQKPEYYAKEKGETFIIKQMTPTEYLYECAVGFNTDIHFLLKNRKDMEKIRRIYSYIGEGNQLPMPFIKYNKNGEFIGQEGIHRAIVAKELGEETIPVLVITKE